MPIMHIYMLEGRSDAQKEAFIAALTQAAVDTLDAPADTIRVILDETKSIHWGKGGVSMARLNANQPKTDTPA